MKSANTNSSVFTPISLDSTKNLHTLDYSGKIVRASDLITQVAAAPVLQRLILRGLMLENLIATWPCAGHPTPQVQVLHLDLSHNHLESRQLSPLLHWLPKLQSLNLTESPELNKEAYSQLPPSLINLEVAVCNLTTKNLQTIALRCSQLECLILRDNRTLDVSALLKIDLPNLTHLDITRCKNVAGAIDRLRIHFPKAKITVMPDVLEW